MIAIIISFAIILAVVVYANAVFPAHELRRKLAEDRAAHQKKLDAEFDAVMNEIIYKGKQTYTRAQILEFGEIITAYEAGEPLEVYIELYKYWEPVRSYEPVFAPGIVYRRAGKLI